MVILLSGLVLGIRAECSLSEMSGDRTVSDFGSGGICINVTSWASLIWKRWNAAKSKIFLTNWYSKNFGLWSFSDFWIRDIQPELVIKHHLANMMASNLSSYNLRNTFSISMYTDTYMHPQLCTPYTHLQVYLQVLCHETIPNSAACALCTSIF